MDADSDEGLVPSSGRYTRRSTEDSSLDSEALSALAAEYVSDELDQEQRTEFENQLQHSAELRSEVFFWRKALGKLNEHGRPHNSKPPGPGFNEVLRRRLERDEAQKRPKKKRFAGLGLVWPLQPCAQF